MSQQKVRFNYLPIWRIYITSLLLIWVATQKLPLSSPRGYYSSKITKDKKWFRVIFFHGLPAQFLEFFWNLAGGNMCEFYLDRMHLSTHMHLLCLSLTISYNTLTAVTSNDCTNRLAWHEKATDGIATGLAPLY